MQASYDLETKNRIEAQLDILTADRSTFTNPDSDLANLVSVQAQRCRESAEMLGLEWRGLFSESHVLLIAKAYFFKKRGDMQSTDH